MSTFPVPAAPFGGGGGAPGENTAVQMIATSQQRGKGKAEEKATGRGKGDADARRNGFQAQCRSHSDGNRGHKGGRERNSTLVTGWGPLMHKRGGGGGGRGSSPRRPPPPPSQSHAIRGTLPQHLRRPPRPGPPSPPEGSNASIPTATVPISILNKNTNVRTPHVLFARRLRGFDKHTRFE